MTTATYQTNVLDISYNGWSNYETWNVALWLQNDAGLYYLCRDMDNYIDTIDVLADMGVTHTPDGVAYADAAVNVIELNSEVFNF